MRPDFAPGSKEQLRLTAHHEAGHFVAGLVWGGDVHRGSATIRPEGDFLGHVRPGFLHSPEDLAETMRLAGASSPGLRETLVRIAHDMIRFLLAGHAAESILLGHREHPLDVTDGDVEDARRYVAAAYESDPRGVDDDYVLCLEFGRARRFLRREWARVEVVARALLRHETIEGEKLSRLLGRVGWIDKVPKYRRLLPDYGR